MFGRKRSHKIPFGMFKLADYGLEAKNARVLERIYHKGHARAWNGKQVLASLIEQYGPPRLPDDQKKALSRVFGIIMWGELAAWKISAELADELEPLEAKMAATSQAFDEARHFYVMHDYLEALGALPESIDWGARRLLESVMSADHLAKKLVGMQLMVEPVALTLFHVVKKLELEPVLTHLLPYFEKDEARHVALGVQYLPAMLSQMNPVEQLSFFLYQFRLITYEVHSGGRIARDLATLGVDPRVLIDTGKGKQLRALEALWEQLPMEGEDIPGMILQRYGDFLSELWVVEGPLRHRLRSAFRVLRHGASLAEHISLTPDVDDTRDTPLMAGVG